MATETIRLVSETSTASQLRMKIDSLFAALDSLKKAGEERAARYQTDSRDRLDAAARDLQSAADPARVLQRQKDLENLKNQFEAETAALDSMTEKIDKRLEELGYHHPREMIEVLEKRLDRLQKIVDEADTQEKKLNDEIRALRERKRRLENRIKAGRVPQTAEPAPTMPPPQTQPAPARRRARTRR